MKTFLKITLLSSLLLFVSTMHSKAQFEQKFSLQLSGGYVHAISPEHFTRVFSDGFSFDGGAQYNFNQSLSMVVLIKYATFLSKTNFGGQRELNMKYNQLGISLCPKYRFLPSSRINPYVFGGFSLNYITYNLSSQYFTDNRTSPVAFGVTGGVGADFRLTDNVALFLQAGLSTVKSKGDWIGSVYTQVGLNISMFKSKSL